MPTKPRPLGDDALSALEGIDELHASMLGVLRDGVAHAFRGDISAVGEAMNAALDRLYFADKATAFTLTGDFHSAERVLQTYRQATRATERQAKP